MTFRLTTFGIIVGLLVAATTWAHCEMPCGIYDDDARFNAIEEHITTIEKAMNQITELSAAGEKNHNQIVRWVNTKEEHSEEIQQTVAKYFITQRIKPVAPDAGAEYDHYVAQLTSFHEMMVYAMKCKQTTDLANVKKLRELTSKARELYNQGHSH